MATVRKEFKVAVQAEQAWEAVRDFGALHRRLVPGFATAAHLEGGDRVVTFFTGTVLRERSSRVIKQTLEDGPHDAA